MVKEILVKRGFRVAVLAVSGVFGATLFFSFVFARPHPGWPTRKPETWLVSKVWIDKNAFKNKSYAFFTASISTLFLGFYPVFFNLEEVSSSRAPMSCSMLTVFIVGC